MSGDKKRGGIKKDRLLIIFLFGVLLLVLAIPNGKNAGKESKRGVSDGGQNISAENGKQDQYTAYMEGRLEHLLSRVDGAGTVNVMITFKSSAEKIVEKDTDSEEESLTESDSQGGSRTTRNRNLGETTVYSGGTSDNQSPYISKELSPEVEGVVVIAEGGDNAVVVKNITEAVQALFGIDTHKIRIMKGRRENQ